MQMLGKFWGKTKLIYFLPLPPSQKTFPSSCLQLWLPILFQATPRMLYYYVRDQNNHNVIEEVVFSLFHLLINNLLVISSCMRLQYQRFEVKER